MHRTDAPANHRGTGTHAKLESSETSKKGMKIFHNFQAVTKDVFIVQEIIRPQIVQQHGNGKFQPLTVLLVVQVPQYTKTHLTPHIHLLIPTQSPASHQHSQSTLHVQTPTLNINAPQFQSNLHQAPPPPLAQNNQSTNYHTNQQQMHTPPTQPFNAQLPQSFNPHVPRPYFPQYPPTNSPSAHSTDSLILLPLQKQWERQERLDMEHNAMEKQKEERKRMKEERNKGKKTENKWKNTKINREVGSTRLLRRSPGSMAPTPVIDLTG